MATDAAGWNAVHHAVRTGSLKVLRLLLESDKGWGLPAWKALDTSTRDRKSALHIAIESGKRGVVEYLFELLKRRTPWNRAVPPLNDILERKCAKKLTPLLLAVKYEQLGAVKLCLESSCNLYARNNILQNSLHLATLAKNTELVRLLVTVDSDKNCLRNQSDLKLRKPKDLDYSKKMKDSYVHIWDHARNGNIALLKAAIENGEFTINQQTPVLKNTPLHAALQAKQITVIRFLCEMHADTSIRNSVGHTPLCLLNEIYDFGFREILRKILKPDCSGPSESSYYSTGNFQGRSMFAHDLDGICSIWTNILCKIKVKCRSIQGLYHFIEKDITEPINITEFEGVLIWLGFSLDYSLILLLISSITDSDNTLLEFATLENMMSNYEQTPNFLVNSFELSR